MLFLRFHVPDDDPLLVDQLPQEVVADVWMCLDLAELSGLFASLIAPWLSSRTSIAFGDRRGCKNESTPCTNNASLTPSPIPTYSDSEVDIITQR